MPEAANATSRCSSADRVVHLDVVRSGSSRIAKSRMSRRRAVVLITVHAILLAHVGLWLAGAFDGLTITPIEPSEAMQTLEFGFVNAGFIFFALALVSTLIFGRFFCGWACHIVMLQDLCGWLMKKVGVRPRPFRSRILIWVPLLIALYMFVWPNLKRWAVFPLLDAVAPAAASYLAPPPQWQGLSNHLVSEHFWENPETGIAFPVVMAIPTLLIAGFAAVYFLGAKGFCTYGCPYGGFFAPIDEWSPGRIRVNDDCEQCGHCTATCTSNVRVHEEVREYGMVVDPGCMKCMDCVSVCPNNALSFGFGKPAVRKGDARNKAPARQYDLSMREDLVLGGVFLAALLCVRGLYLWEGVPFLMAVGFAAVFAFLVYKSWRLIGRRSELVRIQNVNLKWRGRIRPAGWMMLAGVALLSVVLVGNGVVKASTWRAERIMATPPILDFAQAPAAVTRPPEMLAAAEDALAHLKRARGLADGGLALMTHPALWSKLAAMHGVRGDFGTAAHMLRKGIEQRGDDDHACATLAHFMYLNGDRAGAIRYAQDVSARESGFERTFDTLVALAHDHAGLDEAAIIAERAHTAHPDALAPARALAELRLSQGEYEHAESVVRAALTLHPGDLRLHLALAGARFQANNTTETIQVLENAARLFPSEPAPHERLSAIHELLNDADRAAYHANRAEELRQRDR